MQSMLVAASANLAKLVDRDRFSETSFSGEPPFEAGRLYGRKHAATERSTFNHIQCDEAARPAALSVPLIAVDTGAFRVRVVTTAVSTWLAHLGEHQTITLVV